MNKTYKATFKMPAVVHYVVEVSAANQQDALVLAHDLVLEAQPAATVVSSVDPVCAVNIALECVASPPAKSPGGASLPGEAPAPLLEPSEEKAVTDVPRDGFRVQFFDNPTATGLPVLQVPVPTRRMAESAGASALEPLSEFGSAKVLDENNQAISQFFSPRGGWEVEAVGAGGPHIVASWLPDKLSAVKAALKLLKDGNELRSVRVLNFSDRRAGSVLFKELS